MQVLQLSFSGSISCAALSERRNKGDHEGADSLFFPFLVTGWGLNTQTQINDSSRDVTVAERDRGGLVGGGGTAPSPHKRDE